MRIARRSPMAPAVMHAAPAECHAQVESSCHPVPCSCGSRASSRTPRDGRGLRSLAAVSGCRLTPSCALSPPTTGRRGDRPSGIIEALVPDNDARCAHSGRKDCRWRNGPPKRDERIAAWVAAEVRRPRESGVPNSRRALRIRRRVPHIRQVDPVRGLGPKGWASRARPGFGDRGTRHRSAAGHGTPGRK